MMRWTMALGAALGVAAVGVAGARTAQKAEGVPRFAHVFVIIEENKDYDQIVGGANAPTISRLAREYGDATHMYGEVHPSEANYVALLGGDTFGIHDDDPYYCKPGSTDANCAGAAEPGYVDHTVHARDLGDQLVARGLSWKGYYEDLPAPGSLAYIASDPKVSDGSRATALYASKHSGFVNFAQVQSAPDRAERIVGFDQLDRDLASGRLPSFALIVPNQCNEMHGLVGAKVPVDCQAQNKAALIQRGDAEVAHLVEAIERTPAWNGSGNFAIVITFDEGAGKTREGCCGVTPNAISNFGGGHIPTIVVTNHGPHRLADDTPYNHYSLLRTIEDAFGVEEHLGHAANSDQGVKPMAKLFGG
jgi:phosphatidylinositol-3-phosphatase